MSKPKTHGDWVREAEKLGSKCEDIFSQMENESNGLTDRQYDALDGKLERYESRWRHVAKQAADTADDPAVAIKYYTLLADRFLRRSVFDAARKLVLFALARGTPDEDQKATLAHIWECVATCDDPKFRELYDELPVERSRRVGPLPGQQELAFDRRLVGSEQAT